MGITLNPYLNFRGNAREAMEFYESVFGGTLNVATFADYHASTDPSEDGLVMHADLEGPEGIRFMAADAPSRMEFEAGTNFSMSLSGGSEPELRGYFEKLSAGGQVTMALEKAAWGDTFGMCTDRFGIQWLLNITAPEEPEG
jgi:PhnB protein